MKFRELLRISLTNTWRRKLRTGLTIWGMSVGLGAMILLISFAQGLQQTARESFLSSTSLTEIQVNSQSFEQMSAGPTTTEPPTLKADDLTFMRSIPHVIGVYAPVYAPITGIEIDEKRTESIFLNAKPIVAIDASQKDKIERGSWWTNDGDASVVLTWKAAKQFSDDPTMVVGKIAKLSTTIYSEKAGTPGPSFEATVSGVMAEGESGFFGMGGDTGFIAYDLANKIASETLPKDILVDQKNSIYNVTVFVDDSDNVAAVRQVLQEKTWGVQTAEDMLKQLDQGFLIMKVVLGAMGGIALFVALIGIANSMLMAILERTREIGIMVAVGASRRTITLLFLSEASWIGLFGGLLGLVGAWLIGKLIVFGIGVFFSAQQNSGNFPPIVFTIDQTLILGTIVGAILMTLLAAWLPARRAAKLDPVKAIRHE